MTHGLTITESSGSRRAVSEASLSTIGFVATSAVAPYDGGDADAIAANAASVAALDALFPINEPVLITNITQALSAAGDLGTLKPTLQAIADQTTPIMVIVRVAPDDDPAIEESNVLGDVVDGLYTGVQALLNAESRTGQRPRILGAPALDTPAINQSLIVIAQRLRAFPYFAPDGDNVSDNIVDRGNYGQREGMLIWPNWDNDFDGDAVARAMGLRARLDEELGWHYSLSNHAVNGVTGISKDITFDLLDPSTDAGLLNDNQITTLVRNNGFRYWGNRTPSDLPEFAFEVAVRTSHALQEIIAEVMQPFMDNPINVSLIKDILETINAKFRQLVLDERIVGAQAFFDADDNEPSALSQGRPKFRLEYTPAAPMENPQIDLIITDFYYSGFADQLV